ncbi:MAG TPA: hypothetical protein DIC64_00815 [Alphaproteobacteria bacterium]|nr:hypothetical protein [Alphaproteobacteria bacterium]
MTKSKFYQFLKVSILILCGVFCFCVKDAFAAGAEDYMTNGQGMDYGFRAECKNRGIDPDTEKQKCLDFLREYGGRGYGEYVDAAEVNGKLVYFNAHPESGKQTWGAMKGCKPLPARYAEIGGGKGPLDCLLCPVFSVILETDQSMATSSYKALASSFRYVIIVVLALFIAYQTLLSVSAVTKQDVGKYLQTILIQTFKVLVAVLLLSNSAYIYHYVINPLMEAGLEFGLTIIDDDLGKHMKALAVANESSMPAGDISQNLLAQVLSAVKIFSNSAAELPAIGSALMCVSVHSASPGLHLPDVSMLIEGLICYAFGWMIALACCFYLLDCVVRFGIFCTLLPFLIACWPFKITIKYAKTGWDIFMNTFFNFVMMGLVISFTGKLIGQALMGESKGPEGAEDGKKALENVLNGNNVDLLKDMMSLDGVKFLVLIACCIFAFKLVEQVNELAAKVSSTDGGTGIGNKLGGLAANAAKKVAGAGIKAAGKVTGASGAIAGVKDRIAARNDAIRSKLGGGSKTNPNGAGSDDS